MKGMNIIMTTRPTDIKLHVANENQELVFVHPETNTNQVVDQTTGKTIKQTLNDIVSNGVSGRALIASGNLKITPYVIPVNVAGQTEFIIQAPNFVPNVDQVLVHMNGEFMFPDLEYTLNTSGAFPKVVLNDGIEMGDFVHALVFSTSVFDLDATSTVGGGPDLSTIETLVDNKISQLVNLAPASLDTLGEIATALQENDGEIATILNTLATKASVSELALKADKTYVDNQLSGKVDVASFNAAISGITKPSINKYIYNTTVANTKVFNFSDPGFDITRDKTLFFLQAEPLIEGEEYTVTKSGNVVALTITRNIPAGTKLHAIAFKMQ